MEDEEDEENEAPLNVGFRNADRKIPDEPFGAEDARELLGPPREDGPSWETADCGIVASCRPICISFWLNDPAFRRCVARDPGRPGADRGGEAGDSAIGVMFERAEDGFATAADRDAGGGR